MKIKRIFFFMVALSSLCSALIIVGMIVYTKETAQDMARLKGLDDISSAKVFAQAAFNLELHDYAAQQSMGLPTRKPFLYLTQTEQCLPPYLAKSSQIGDPATCNCDVLVLSYQDKCQADQDKQSHISYLFDPNTLFPSGRNVLFFAAMKRRPGYHYYIFLNDDTVLKFNRFTPTNMTKMSPFRVVEKWLSDYEPAVGVLDYKQHGASIMLDIRRHICGITETSLIIPTVFFDAIFNAFHHKAVEHILPYPTQYERECIFTSNRNTMIVVEVKFGGQALLFAPVTANNLKHRRHDKKCREKLITAMREFTGRIKQEAPLKLRNHVIFKMLLADTDSYLLKPRPDRLNYSTGLPPVSRSVCVNATRRQPIIPYRRLLNMVHV